MIPAPAPAPEGVYCTFHLGDGLFGIDARLVQSVNLPPPLTPLPLAPDAVRGYANLRGQIHLVLDLRKLLNLGATPVGPDSRLVVFKAALGDPFGVLTDRVGDVTALRAEQIEARRPPESAGGAGRSPDDDLVSGVGMLDGELITLLDARKLLPAVERSLANGRRATPFPLTETAS